jgi:hypothetical protein
MNQEKWNRGAPYTQILRPLIIVEEFFLVLLANSQSNATE